MQWKIEPIRDGKILRYVSYWDRGEAFRAAGIDE